MVELEDDGEGAPHDGGFSSACWPFTGGAPFVERDAALDGLPLLAKAVLVFAAALDADEDPFGPVCVAPPSSF